MIHHAPAEDFLLAIEDASVDLIVVDPPYFQVAEEDWDKQWRNPTAYLQWLGGIADEWRRILRPNGSLYCFASARMAFHVEALIRERFEVLNSARWLKRDSPQKRIEKEALRSYVSLWEACIFAEHFGADSVALGESGWASKCEELRGFVFEPIRAYLEGERLRAGIARREVNAACGVATMAGNHYFGRSQWQLPTAEHYASMQALFNRKPGEFLRKGYEYLRKDYEDLRKDYGDLRRPFNVSRSVPWTDTWEYSGVPAGRNRHPCEKPLRMIRDILEASSRPGGLVLDCFAGSGTTWAAAIDTGRRFVGCEKDLEWVENCRERAERHASIAEARPVQGRKKARTITGPLFMTPRAQAACPPLRISARDAGENECAR